MKKMLVLILLSIFFISCSKSITTNDILIEKEYYQTGELKSEIEYKGNVKHGKFLVYHKNGQLKGKGYFKNDEPNGIILGYNEEGIKEIQMSYKDGIKDGLWIKYQDEFRVELQVVNGEPVEVNTYNDYGETWINEQWVEL